MTGIKEAVGIKETKELLIGINEVAIFLVTIFKDGVNLADFGAVWHKLICDGGFRSKLQAAYSEFSKIPQEFSDLSLIESMEILKLQADYVTKIIEALRKEETTSN